jgi:hypothetical protein
MLPLEYHCASPWLSRKRAVRTSASCQRPRVGASSWSAISSTIVPSCWPMNSVGTPSEGPVGVSAQPPSACWWVRNSSTDWRVSTRIWSASATPREARTAVTTEGPSRHREQPASPTCQAPSAK